MPPRVKHHVAWPDGYGGDVLMHRLTPDKNDEVPQRMRSVIPSRGMRQYPYRVFRLR